MQYVAALLILFLRSVLVFIARRFVLLVVLALVSNFWESFRNLIADLIEKVRVNMVFYLYKIKDSISLVVSAVADNVDTLQQKYQESRNFIDAISSNPELREQLQRANIEIPDLPVFEINTDELRAIPEKVDAVKAELKLKLDEILDGFTLEEVESILRTQILEAPDSVMQKAAETVKVDDLFSVNQTLPQVDWITLNHKDYPTVSNPEKWQLNDIYRILVGYFSREERLALAAQLAKKDYFKKAGNDDRTQTK